jgi:hypothetical protein
MCLVRLFISLLAAHTISSLPQRSSAWYAQLAAAAFSTYRLASAGVVRALARSGGAYLWASSMAGYEDAKVLCLAGLEDPCHEVRTAFAQALGEIAVASISDAGEIFCVGAQEVMCRGLLEGRSGFLRAGPLGGCLGGWRLCITLVCIALRLGASKPQADSQSCCLQPRTP